MNGYELANQFRRVRKKLCFSSIEADLFYELVGVCNDEGWPDTFHYPNALLCATIGTSEKSLISARNRLQQAGLLNFISGHKRNPTKYSFLALPEVSKKGSKKVSKSDSTNGSTTGGNASDSNKTKTETKPSFKKEAKQGAGESEENLSEGNSSNGQGSSAKQPEKEKEKSCAKKEKALVYPFSTESFVRLWQLWKRYKKEQHKFTYTSQITEQKALDLLKPYDEDFATLLIERAMAKGWKGFVHQGTQDEYLALNTIPLNGSQNKNFNNHAANSTTSNKQPSGETAEQAAARYTQYNPNKRNGAG